MVRPVDSLIEKNVIVYTSVANYRGVLKEISEESVSLQGRTGWLVVPMDRIKDIRPFSQ